LATVLLCIPQQGSNIAVNPRVAGTVIQTDGIVLENGSMKLFRRDCVRQIPFLRRTRVLQSRDGQAAIELTLAFILFFTLFMGIVEFSHLLYTKVTLQHALRTAGRYMVTGRTGTDGSGNSIPRDQMIHDVFCANVIATGLACPTLASGNFQFVCLPSPATVCSQPGGGPNQTVMVTVIMNKPAMMPFFSQFYPPGGVQFTLHTTWKNEPFTTS
jgi:Flp pilus assembly protein TadG